MGCGPVRRSRARAGRAGRRSVRANCAAQRHSAASARRTSALTDCVRRPPGRLRRACARCFSVGSATCWIPFFPMSFNPFRLKPTICVVKAPRSSAVITRNTLASADFGAGSHR